MECPNQQILMEDLRLGVHRAGITPVGRAITNTKEADFHEMSNNVLAPYECVSTFAMIYIFYHNSIYACVYEHVFVLD